MNGWTLEQVRGLQPHEYAELVVWLIEQDEKLKAPDKP